MLKSEIKTKEDKISYMIDQLKVFNCVYVEETLLTDLCIACRVHLKKFKYSIEYVGLTTIEFRCID